ncbi:MAG: hypothetical protein ABW167_13400 [Baekduia sp.]
MLLLGVVLALCAFVLPSVASAVSWSPVGTSDGRLDSGNLGFSIPFVSYGWGCTASSFNVTVDTAVVATITGVSFANCHNDPGTNIATHGCTQTGAGTNFPWRLTAPTTTDVIINGVDIDFSFVTTPGTIDGCILTGLNVRLTGSLTASFTPGTAGSRRIDFGPPAGAFTAHIPGFGPFRPTVRGTAVATGLLNVID